MNDGRDAPGALDAAEILASVEAELDVRNTLSAFDIVNSAMAPDEKGVVAEVPRKLKYYAVRLRAELGDFHGALQAFDDFGMGKSEDVDTLALKGRIYKDIAFQCDGVKDQHQALRQAAEAYRRAMLAVTDYFPAINYAALLAMLGDREAAAEQARALLARPELVEPTSYWAAASAAEALLILGRCDEAGRVLADAQANGAVAAGHRVSTIRQFERLAACGVAPACAVDDIVAPLRPPPVVIYCGHMFRENDPEEPRLVKRIDASLDAIGATIAYGPLACGADILIAERMLARGQKLNVVLPFAVDDFVRYSVAIAGESWVPRFHACMAAAESVTLATEGAFVGDDEQFAYGTYVAMGLAEIRAQDRLSHAVQLAVVSDDAARTEISEKAGTTADMRIWQALGRETIRVAAGPVDRTRAKPEVELPGPIPPRAAKSIIFGDYAGFSRLGERELPLFADHVMGTIGRVLDEHDGKVLFRNTWGDAVYAVIEDPATAARIAVEMQRRLTDLPPALQCKDKEAGMRIGVHHGPIYRGTDQVTHQDLWFGTEVTRTARIEPATPVKVVYCTAAFAAMLALQGGGGFTYHYVGKVKLAKKYGELAMYRLVSCD